MEVVKLTKVCIKCKKELSFDNFEKYDHHPNSCSDCCKKRGANHYKKQLEKIKKASGDRWWIESFCIGSYYYNGKPKIKK